MADEEQATEMQESLTSKVTSAVDAARQHAPVKLGGKHNLGSDMLKPRKCGTRVIVGLLDVDDVRSEFTVDLELLLDWDEPSLKSAASASIVFLPELPKDVYRPHVHIPNANKCEKTMEKYFVNSKKGHIFVHLNWTVTIREPLELNRFPFDKQCLKYYFESENVIFAQSTFNKDEFPLGWPMQLDRKKKNYLDPVFVRAYTALPHWKLVEAMPMESWSFGASHSAAGKLKLERRFQYYFYNVLIPLFLLVLASLCTCFLEPTLMSERASISVTFLLALVAYKYVLTSLLPHISYLTYLDLYVLLCFTLLALGVFENVVLRVLLVHDYIADADAARDVDYIYAGVVGGFWLILHAFIVFFWKIGAFRMKWANVIKNDDKDRMELESLQDVDVSSGSNENTYTMADVKQLWGFSVIADADDV